MRRRRIWWAFLDRPSLSPALFKKPDLKANLMKAFWWFEDDAIAGMARPGFNSVHWFHLPFDEAVLMGWVGQHSSGPADLASFRQHLRDYAPKIFPFYGLDERSGPVAIKIFENPAGLLDVFLRLQERTNTFVDIKLEGEHLHFAVNQMRLGTEIKFLRGHGIKRVVSLTEAHHSRHVLQDHFELYHLAIRDLGAPRMDQVEALAQVISDAKRSQDKIAVHCLAGIGRTSTMLIAAHLVLGEKLSDLQERLKIRNPSFVLTGSQAEFIRSIAKS